MLGTKEDVLVSMTRSVSPMPAANEPKRASIADVYKRFGGGSGRGGVGLPQPMTCTVGWHTHTHTHTHKPIRADTRARMCGGEIICCGIQSAA